MNAMKMNVSQQCLACAVALGGRLDGAVGARRADARVWFAATALGVIASIVLAWQAAPVATMTPDLATAVAVTAVAVRPSQPDRLLDCPVPTLEGMSCPVPELPSP
jgi:hypothetical protein